MSELKRYKAKPGLAEVGGIKVVRGHVKMTEQQALYHLSIGRLTLPGASKAAAVDDGDSDG